ncbi:MAG: potassium transporter TrkG, partial [Myxococcota bacterium]
MSESISLPDFQIFLKSKASTECPSDHKTHKHTFSASTIGEHLLLNTAHTLLFTSSWFFTVLGYLWIQRTPHTPSLLHAGVLFGLFANQAILLLQLVQSFKHSVTQANTSIPSIRWWRQYGLVFALSASALPLLAFNTHALLVLVLAQAIYTCLCIIHAPFFPKRWQQLLERPALLVMISFALLISIGTLLLMLPLSTQIGISLKLEEALFTATSAACVTGLVLKDTATTFSWFGQLVILGLIQIGGLSLITFASFLLWSTGQRLSVRSYGVLSNILDQHSTQHTLALLRSIVWITLIAEGIGTLILWFAWRNLFPSTIKNLYYAAFHSVSAFCNAGFALFPDSLVRFRADPWVNVPIIVLIFFGSTGFPVWASLFHKQRLQRWRTQRSKFGWQLAFRCMFRDLPLNTKIVLIGQISTTLLVTLL